MIIFQNPGEIDVRAIKILGINSKECESPIGFFGTGLKYAISVLLRENQEIEIFSGLEQFTFSKKHVSIRGVEVDIVCMNGEELGFTTSLGKKWELWMAYRELYSNTMDEGGVVYESFEETPPSVGSTLISVDGNAFSGIYRDRHKFIIDDEHYPVLFKGKGVEIRGGGSTNIFYRGINIGSCGRASSIYTYNITNAVELTEDRKYSNQWAIIFDIQRTMDELDDEELIENILTAKGDTFETTFDFAYAGLTKANSKAVEVTRKLCETRVQDVNESAIIQVSKLTSRVEYKEFVLGQIEEIQLKKALSFCQNLKLEVDIGDLMFIESFDGHIYGAYHRGKIFLTRKTFEAGTKQLVMTLIEERAHMLFGLDDCTRGMQEYFLNLAITLGERLQGEPL